MELKCLSDIFIFVTCFNFVTMVTCYIEPFQANVCFYGDDDIILLDMSYSQCVRSCRARTLCTAITYQRTLQVCRLHFREDVSKIECSMPGHVYSNKSSWLKQQIDGCSCMATETCNEVSLLCGITECHAPEKVMNGEYLGNLRKVGDRIRYVCDDAYVQSGPQYSTCMPDGTWSAAVDSSPLCVQLCSATAPAGVNTVDPSITDRLPGTVITYSCLPNFQPQDSTTAMSLTCAPDGTWGTPPTCESADCPTDWVKAGGRCLLFVDQRATWWQSKSFCEAQGATLAHVYSLGDLANIESVITCAFGSSLPGCHPWLDFNDISYEGQFVSSANKNLDPEVITLLQTYNSEEADCSYYSTSANTIRIWSCSEYDTYICEKAV